MPDALTTIHTAALDAMKAVFAFWQEYNALQVAKYISPQTDKDRRPVEVGLTDQFVLALGQSLRAAKVPGLGPKGVARSWMTYCREESQEGWDIDWMYRDANEMAYHMIFQAKCVGMHNGAEYADFSYEVGNKTGNFQAELLMNHVESLRLLAKHQGHKLVGGYLLFASTGVSVVWIDDVFNALQACGWKTGEAHNVEVYKYLLNKRQVKHTLPEGLVAKLRE
ncbi:hypothetical protein PUNSTDRAFT_145042 [Punctularia strigosozonata HHB-11173 SS5]|uniref:uncharacterized protein n=1 Tax=Punctularia strigosozonata (strain HHB-11173) TaxID=741275 RepID=UPI0004417D51|nr:uncharacterized protein PUNSTDRAFT_145042 [Punctularia strigosozonata HHB-11173 SS5]EIN06440.1 hypothetical protein PUNSTDRAFT_145042 [Punctularia strigosozonata HHB-11173 SS5]